MPLDMNAGQRRGRERGGFLRTARRKGKFGAAGTLFGKGKNAKRLERSAVFRRSKLRSEGKEGGKKEKGEPP